MSRHVAPSITRERWAYLRALKPSPPRYLHVSARAAMLPNPQGTAFPAIPWVQRPGVTYRKSP